MTAVNWYFTTTTRALSGYTTDPATNEVALSTTAPSGSPTLTGSVPKNTDIFGVFVGATESAPHDANRIDWERSSSDPDGGWDETEADCVINVTAIHADISLTLSMQLGRWNSSGVLQDLWGPPSNVPWDSPTGTGVKTATPTSGNALMGYALPTDQYGPMIFAQNVGHMDTNDITITLGSSSYVEFSPSSPRPVGMSLVCGAECQIASGGSGANDKSHWCSDGGVAGNDSTPATSATVARSGSRSLYFSSSATGLSFIWHQNHSPIANDVPTYFRGYFRLPDVGPTNSDIEIWATNAAEYCALLVSSTGGISLKLFGSSGDVTSSTNNFTASVDTWYGVEIEVVGGVAAKWRVDTGSGWSTSETVTNATSTTDASRQGLGIGTDAGEADWKVYWDDFVMGWGPAGYFYDDTGTNGVSGRVLRYAPSADGTHFAWPTGSYRYDGVTNIVNTATDMYSYLDDDDMTSTADFIEDNSNQITYYYELTFEDETTEDDPRGVSLVAHYDGSAASQGPIAKISDDDWTSEITGLVDPAAATAAGQFLQSGIAQAPSDIAWTRAAFNALKLRYGFTSSGNTELHSIALEVEWTAEAVVERVPYHEPMVQLLPQ